MTPRLPGGERSLRLPESQLSQRLPSLSGGGISTGGGTSDGETSDGETSDGETGDISAAQMLSRRMNEIDTGMITEYTTDDSVAQQLERRGGGLSGRDR